MTNIWVPVNNPNGFDASNAGYSFRNELNGLLAGKSSTDQIRVGFWFDSAGATNTYDFDAFSIGVQSSNEATTATPVQLTYLGNPFVHVSVAAFTPTQFFSDWITTPLTFTSANNLIVTFDMTSGSASPPGSGVTWYQSGNSPPGGQSWFYAANATAGSASPGAGSNQAGIIRIVNKVETQAGGVITSLFRVTNLDGLGSGGPFFDNPIG
jgi:hypothetical protein